MREAETKRKTNETDTTLRLVLEGTGEYEISTGCGFLDHMLELLARHGSFDLKVKCIGDTDVDYHHTVEDVGASLGLAFSKALGDCRGITRYGSILLPMDEALVSVALDISGRGGFYGDLKIPSYRVGDFDTELAGEFFSAFSRTSKITLHINTLNGTNSHHIIEAAFKGFARALKQAVAIDKDSLNRIPSTKGMLKED